MTAPRLLVLSVRMLALIGGLGLVASRECQMLFVGLFFSFFVLGLFTDQQPHLSRLIGKVQPVLALLMLAIAFVDFFRLSNSFLLAAAHFLLSVQGLRLLTLQTNRENLGSVLLSSLMMLSASTLSVDWTYFFFFLLFILALIWTLMIHTLLDESRRNAAIMANPPPLTRILPLIRSSALVGFMVAFFCCAFVFIVFPRFNLQGFRGQFLQPVRKTGFTSQVNLSGGSAIFRDNTVVMRVEVDPADRPLWSGYLRGQTLDEYQDGVWRRSSTRQPQRLYRAFGMDISLTPNRRKIGRLLHQRMYLESMETPLLFATPSPVSITIDRPSIDLYNDGSFQRMAGDVWRVRYEIDSVASTLDPIHAPESAGKPGPHVKEQTTIPGLAAVVTLGSRSAGEKASRIAAYLQKNFTYSLAGNPSTGHGDDVINDFLFRYKRGHCEYFASAMCMMLRSLGIPCRMVTGFISREWNRRGNYFVVRMKNAHAWVEVQMEDGTWAGFDPSPRDVESGFATGFLDNWAQAMDYLNLRWNRYILSYDFEKQVQVIQSMTNTGPLANRLSRWRRWTLSFRGINWHETSPASELRSSETVLEIGWKFGVLVLLIVAVVFMIMYRRRRPQVWFYPALVRALERRAGRRVGTATLGEFAKDNMIRLQPQVRAFAFLIDAYYSMRFSNGLCPVDEESVRRTLAEVRRPS